jgi:hypothetical protein
MFAHTRGFTRSLLILLSASFLAGGSAAVSSAQNIDINQAIQQAKSMDGVTDVKVDLMGQYHGTFDCGGHNARIGGGQSTITLKNCKVIAIDGGNNSVTIYGASSIRILGSSNTVKWSGSQKPVIDNRGSDNNIVKL